MNYNAYGGFYPNFYQQPQPQPQPQAVNATYGQPAGGNNSIIWVQGEASAKAFPVPAGQAVLLMDSEKQTMYIKSTDQSGMPQPLRVFDYTERLQTPAPEPTAKKEDYISRQEFEDFKEEIKKNIKGIRKAEIDIGEEAQG